MITIRGLSYSYQPDQMVLQNVDLDLRPGEHVSILGHNGSGKSTLLKCISGLLSPTTGSITSGSRIGLVFQNPDDQIVSPVVESEIAFGLENLGVPREEMLIRVQAVLDRFDLTKVRRHDPHALSGGERQRLAVASVVVTRPNYLLFDEPYSMLDPAFRDELSNLIRSLLNDGIAPIVVSQDPDRALEADRLVVIDEGRITHDDSPADILASPSRLPSRLATSTVGRLSIALGFPEPVPITARDLESSISNYPVPPLSLSRERVLSTDPIVEIRSLRFSYNPGLPTEHEVLKGIDLSVNRGEAISLMGPGGSGKSTLGLHLNGLHTPAYGSVVVDGLNAAAPETHDLLRQRVGLVFQFPESQLFAETVREDIAYGPVNLGMDDVDDRVESAITKVGLSPDRYLSRNPFTLSGGEKRRVALAGVLATSPSILVLDEPNAGLDPSGADDLDAILEGLHQSGTTLVVITHDLARAAAFSDRIVGLVEGRVSVDLPTSEFLRDPGHLTTLRIPLPPAIDLVRRLRLSGSEIPESIHTSDQLAAGLRNSDGV